MTASAMQQWKNILPLLKTGLPKARLAVTPLPNWAAAELIPLLQTAEEFRNKNNMLVNSCQLSLRYINNVRLLANIDERGTPLELREQFASYFRIPMYYFIIWYMTVTLLLCLKR